MASTSSSATFYTTFQSLKSKITNALNTDETQEASRILVDLKTQLRENVVYLPPYDQRSYETQIHELEGKLSSKRPKSSKTKFSFTKSNSKSKVPNTMFTTDSYRAEPSNGSSSISLSEAKDVMGHSGDAVRLEGISGRRLGLPDLSHPQAGSSYSTSSSALTTSTVILQDLKKCIIDLRSTPNEQSLGEGSRNSITSIHANNLTRCILIVPIEGSILLHSIKDCILIISSHQFRMHDSHNTTVLISIPSMPIIEHSTRIQFGALPPDLLLAGDIASRHWEVQDFDWVREGQSPNWTRIDDAKPAYGNAVLAIQDSIRRSVSGGGEEIERSITAALACWSSLFDS